MKLWVGVGYGDILDARTIITASEGYGQMPVADVSYICKSLRDPLDELDQLKGLHVLPNMITPDFAALTDEGGGKVGIPITNNTLFGNSLGCNYAGQQVKVFSAGPVDGVYQVESESDWNKLVVTETYSPYTFAEGDYVSLFTPKKIAANLARKELIVYNPSDTYACYWGSKEIGWSTYIPGGISPLRGNSNCTGKQLYHNLSGRYLFRCRRWLRSARGHTLH